MLGPRRRTGFSLAVESRGYSCCDVQASHGGGFSCWGAQALGHVCFCSCGSQAESVCVMWELPRLGINPCLLHCQILYHWATREALYSPFSCLFSELKLQITMPFLTWSFPIFLGFFISYCFSLFASKFFINMCGGGDGLVAESCLTLATLWTI